MHADKTIFNKIVGIATLCIKYHAKKYMIIISKIGKSLSFFFSPCIDEINPKKYKIGINNAGKINVVIANIKKMENFKLAFIKPK